MTKKTRSEEFKSLWQENRNRAPLVASVVIRVMLAMGFIFYIFFKLFHFSGILVFLLALALVIFMVSNRFIKRQSFRIEQTFKHNLRAREIRAEYLGEKRPEYASSLLSKDLHLADFDIPEDIDWAGKSLAELNFGQRFGVHVVSILRGRKRINIPKAADRIYPQDRIQVIGTDSEMEVFGAEISKAAHPIDENLIQDSEMILRQLPIHADSPFLGKTLRDSGIRNKYHCLIAGVETEDGQRHTPDVHVPFNDGDTLWIVGERQDVAHLLTL